MKYLALFLALFWVTSLDAINYVAYHHETAKAEVLIHNGEYNAALVIYKRIFAEYPYGFYKDIHNACVCACKANKLSDAKNYAEKLVLHGYEMSDFSNSGFTPLRKNEKLWKNFEKKYPILRHQYSNDLNHQARIKYYELFVSDQNVLKTVKGFHSQDSVFYHQAIELHDLFLKNGFPSLGVNKDTLDFKIFVQLRHYFGLVNRYNQFKEMQKDEVYSSMRFSKIQFGELLLTSLHNGKLLPQTYADIVSYMDYSHPFGDLMLKIDYATEEVTVFMDLNEESLKEVNERRSSIGLQPVNDNPHIGVMASWFSSYPFKEIKQAYIACDDCKTRSDYLDIQDQIVERVRRSYRNDLSEQFILEENEIKNVWILGIGNYETNINKSVDNGY